MAPMEKQIKAPEKGLNEMEISNLSNSKFKTLVIKILKELSEDLNSIKKDPVRNEGPLIEVRTIYRETKVEWIKPRIKSRIWNTRKQKTTNQNSKKKKESKKMRIV